jgi:quercetin dioxygenase-like cupin family protein
MTRITLPLALTLALGITLGALGATALHAQDGFKRTMLQQQDIAGVPGREAVMVLAEFPAGAVAGKHYHNATEIGYVLEGSGVLMIDGQPDQPLVTGKAYHVDDKKRHDAKNTGSGPLKVLVMWVAEKGKPLAVPVK